MRQNIKYALFIIYWMIEISFILGIFLVSSVSVIASFCWLLPLLYFELDDSSRFTALLYPKLPKRIVHESGDYYIKYFNQSRTSSGTTIIGRYKIFFDKYFYYKQIFTIEDYNINDQSELIKDIKSKLNEIYKIEIEQIRHNKLRSDLLNEWDGYTSVDVKRDDKLSKLVK